MTLSSTALPGAPHIGYVGDTLYIEGVSAAALAEQFGTPLYVYSKAAILANLRPYQDALGPIGGRVCYAMKANSSLAILQLLAKAGCGFDIVSGGELKRVLAAGGNPASVVFSGVGKTAAEMRLALEHNVMCFNVESVAELKRLNEVALGMPMVSGKPRRAPISLRINPNVDPKTHPYISTGLKGNKFGVSYDDALAIYKLAATLPGIEVVGIDCHIGSQITEGSPYQDALDRLLDLVEACEAAGIAIHHIDMGGGIGIRYDDEAPPAADAVWQHMIERVNARGHGSKTLLAEPGRSIVGNAGVLLTRVEYMKPGETKNFAIVDAAMNDLMRPALYQSYHAMVPAVQRDVRVSRVDVVGPVCESGDWLGRERDLAVEQGDVIAILSAGAYSMAMASNYNTRPRSAEVLVDGATPHLIRQREAVEQLFAGESLVAGERPL